MISGSTLIRILSLSAACSHCSPSSRNINDDDNSRSNRLSAAFASYYRRNLEQAEYTAEARCVIDVNNAILTKHYKKMARVGLSSTSSRADFAWLKGRASVKLAKRPFPPQCHQSSSHAACCSAQSVRTGPDTKISGPRGATSAYITLGGSSVLTGQASFSFAFWEFREACFGT